MEEELSGRFLAVTHVNHEGKLSRKESDLVKRGEGKGTSGGDHHDESYVIDPPPQPQQAWGAVRSSRFWLSNEPQDDCHLPP